MKMRISFTQVILSLILILALVLVVSCGSETPAEVPAEEAAEQPAEEAAEEAEEEPAEEMAEEGEAEEATEKDTEEDTEEVADESDTPEADEDKADEDEAAEDEMAEETEMPALLNAIFYADTWTWPYQTDKIAHLSRGKFYIPVQDEDKIAILDPDAPDYDLHFVETDFVQPHHPWMQPGMRYNWINFQSEGKGDHDAIAIMDTWSDEIVKYIHTGTNDPFHMAFSPTDPLLVTADLDGSVGRVHLFDTDAHELIASIETNGVQTRDIVITHDGRYAFIGHQGYDPENGLMGAVDVLDLTSQEIVKSIGEGRCRAGKMSNDGRYAFYSCGRVDQILVIDTATLEEAARIDLPEGSQPFNIGFRPDDKFAYVGFLGADQLGIIDVENLEFVKALDSGTRTNSTYMHPYAPVAITTNDGTDSHVSVIDIENNEIIEKIETGGKGTHNGQWSPDGRWFIVTNRLGDSVTLLAYNDESGMVEWVDDIVVGFAANGVHWAPYFCGADQLTPDNVMDITNAAPATDDGACDA